MLHAWLCNFYSTRSAVTITLPLYLTATLQQVADNPVLAEQRSNVLKERQETYEWQMFPDTGVPSGINESILTLPLDEKFERVKMVNFLGNALGGGIASLTAPSRLAVLHKLQRILSWNFDENTSVSSLHDFEFIATTLEKENIKDSDPPKDLPVDPNIPTYEGYRWVSDVEFGRQILNGVNPVLIRKCTKIPDNFAVTSEMVYPLMNNGKTLEEEMKVSFQIIL